MKSGSKFSWKLEGFDKIWSSPSVNRIITYTNIPSGVFTLKIKLLDNSLSNVVSERSLVIEVIPPFWRTIWFWTLVFAIISGVILLYLLYYINRLKQEHTEEKVRFFTNTAHDIRTSLTLIKAPGRRIKQGKRPDRIGEVLFESGYRTGKATYLSRYPIDGFPKGGYRQGTSFAFND